VSDKLPANLRRLWAPDEGPGREPRLGLSRQRIVQAAIELADADGLDAVSMGRVAERLGFTTMSLYRHVANKNELLAHMHDTAWEAPASLDTPGDGWRADLERWCWALRAAMQRHPWLERIRLGERAGTPSQLTWLDRGLRALAGTALSEHEKTEVLLLLNGYVFWEARFLADTEHAARVEGFPTEEATEAYGELLSALVDAERFPALRRAVDAGIFEAPGRDRYADFAFGLARILDGIDCLTARRTPADPAPPPGGVPLHQG
jgi:AcrR family transcriptional regulator